MIAVAFNRAFWCLLLVSDFSVSGFAGGFGSGLSLSRSPSLGPSGLIGLPKEAAVLATVLLRSYVIFLLPRFLTRRTGEGEMNAPAGIGSVTRHRPSQRFPAAAPSIIGRLAPSSGCRTSRPSPVQRLPGLPVLGPGRRLHPPSLCEGSLRSLRRPAQGRSRTAPASGLAGWGSPSGPSSRESPARLRLRAPLRFAKGAVRPLVRLWDSAFATKGACGLQTRAYRRGLSHS